MPHWNSMISLIIEYDLKFPALFHAVASTLTSFLDFVMRAYYRTLAYAFVS